MTTASAVWVRGIRSRERRKYMAALILSVPYSIRAA